MHPWPWWCDIDLEKFDHVKYQLVLMPEFWKWMLTFYHIRLYSMIFFIHPYFLEYLHFKLCIYVNIQFLCKQSCWDSQAHSLFFHCQLTPTPSKKSLKTEKSLYFRKSPTHPSTISTGCSQSVFNELLGDTLELLDLCENFTFCSSF